MRRYAIFVVTLLALAWGATAHADEPTALPPAEAEQLWNTARRLIRSQMDGIGSLSGRYTLQLYEPQSKMRRDYRVDFAFEDGFLLNQQSYQGKSWQRWESNPVGEKVDMREEQATLGGRNGEVRSRDSGFSLKVGPRDDRTPLISCPLPHDAAGYAESNSLLTMKPPATLESASRLADGRVRFVVISQISGSKTVLECDPQKSYLPELVEGYVKEDGEMKPVSTLHIDFAALRSPDGGTWYYPTSGREIGYFPTGEEVVKRWEADVASLKVNEDIPDETFMLRPRPDEALVRRGDYKVLEMPRERSERKASLAAGESEAAATPAGVQQPFDAGGGWVRPLALSAGAAAVVVGVVLLIRRRAA